MLMRFVVVAMILATPSFARADMGMLPGDDVLTFGPLWLHESTCDGYCSAVQDNLLTDQTQCSGSGTCGGSQDQAMPRNAVTSPLFSFNYAHCVCSRFNLATPIDGFYEDRFSYEIDFTGTTPAMKPLDLWVGTGCDDMVSRQMNCHQITDPDPGITYISQIGTTHYVRPDVRFWDVMEPEPSHQAMGICENRTLTTSVFAMAAINGGTYDYSISHGVTVDSQPPPLPDAFTVEGAESAIQISWTPPAAGVGDVKGYQVLCETVDDQGNETPAKTSHPSPMYQTARMLCGTGDDAPVYTATTIDTSNGSTIDAASVSPGALMAKMDPSFICGESMISTDTSLRVEGLKDGTSYVLIFAAIDQSGNASATYFTSAVTPKPARDFWQDLHDQGSTAEGGFCLIADTYGDNHPLTRALRGFRDGTLADTVLGRALIRAYYATLAPLGAVVRGHVLLRIVAGVLLLPLVAIALAWHLLGLPLLLLLVALVVFRRRFTFAFWPRVVAVLALLVPGIAHAQDPYWSDSKADSDNFADGKDDVRWHAGIRLGPYLPQIDSQVNKSPGPYQQMFGSDKSWLPMLDVDYILWRDFGQLGIGISAGYMSKSAHAWAVCAAGDVTCIDTPGDPHRTRSKGDENSFHLIPAALTATYRFTYLDDEYGIPIVPYGRAGLGYYVWWSDGPNGNASVYTNPTTTMSTTAKGASMGIVGSLGLAIRAERIDSDAARSMRESGLEHAGFYAEYQEAWVDGFGNSKKLAVGDHTWFAGVDFEF
jgi:outer membrane protein W